MIADLTFEEAQRQQKQETLQRLRNGMEGVADAVQRLNDLGRPLGIPPVSIRFQPAPDVLNGYVPYDHYVWARQE